ncbi:uncharacterized protein LOC111208018 [Brassica napus]|uniref:uncharacterized protein LOC111208018 n=1 Tax=Brassica napus TaxID=3708 RepID=UPI00207A74DC|nr:uncharacterized protein LOC111208018 [Brassica napus]
MDAFSGYNQILMHPEDQEKTSFMTSRGIYCYKVMPFGLKNAGSTYQRLVNMMFADKIGRTMEVYIDDVLVKSLEAEDHISHLQKAFSTLKKYNMKLNPAKCSFGFSSGKFLGYIVTHRGIGANPEQIRAIHSIPSPKNVKEAHPIVVVTSFPVKLVLHKPEVSGRQAKWAVELGEYDVIFRPATAIKSQVLAEFVAEFSPALLPALEQEVRLRGKTKEEGEWILHVDGSSNARGAGVGIVLTSPTGDTASRAMRCNFKATNNESKYEALIAGLTLAHQTGAENIQVFGDSQLIINQPDEYPFARAPMASYLGGSPVRGGLCCRRGRNLDYPLIPVPGGRPPPGRPQRGQEDQVAVPEIFLWPVPEVCHTPRSR